MSHKKKFSNNWKKAKARVQRIHTSIANARMDFLHKTSSTISKNHAMVCIEDLQVRNMSRSAAGTTKAPGKKVRTNGGQLIAVPSQNTSRTCPACGHFAKENRETQARFKCVECGFEEHVM